MTWVAAYVLIGWLLVEFVNRYTRWTMPRRATLWLLLGWPILVLVYIIQRFMR